MASGSIVGLGPQASAKYWGLEAFVLFVIRKTLNLATDKPSASFDRISLANPVVQGQLR